MSRSFPERYHTRRSMAEAGSSSGLLSVAVRLKVFARSSKQLSRDELRELLHVAEICKLYLKERAVELLQNNAGQPCVFQYSCDTACPDLYDDVNGHRTADCMPSSGTRTSRKTTSGWRCGSDWSNRILLICSKCRSKALSALGPKGCRCQLVCSSQRFWRLVFINRLVYVRVSHKHQIEARCTHTAYPS